MGRCPRDKRQYTRQRARVHRHEGPLCMGDWHSRSNRDALLGEQIGHVWAFNRPSPATLIKDLRCIDRICQPWFEIARHDPSRLGSPCVGVTALAAAVVGEGDAERVQAETRAMFGLLADREHGHPALTWDLVFGWIHGAAAIAAIAEHDGFSEKGTQGQRR